MFLETTLFPPYRTTATLLALTMVALLSSCTKGGSPATGERLRDDLGREILLPANVGRVVTLAPNLTEIVYALGGESRLAGTDSYSDEPAAAKLLPKVGGLNPSVERIASLRPDLVLATTNGNPPSLEPALASAKVPLFVVRTDRIDDIPRAIVTVGRILNLPAAGVVARNIENDVAAQKRVRARKPRVMFVVWADPLYVGGTATFADDLIRLTGGTNAVEAGGWPQLSLERLAASVPDLLLYPDRSVPPAQMQALVRRIPELSRSRIIAVDENLFTRPGPRMAAAAARLNAILDDWERGE